MKIIFLLIELILPFLLLGYAVYFITGLIGKMIGKTGELFEPNLDPSQIQMAAKPANFTPSQASLNEMVEDWLYFSEHLPRLIPEIRSDIFKITETLKALRHKDMAKDWGVPANRPPELRDIAHILYHNYPKFILEYTQLPKNVARHQKSSNGKTAFDMLQENSHFLTEQIEELVGNIYQENLKEMAIEEKFVQQKFHKTNSR